MFFINYWCVPKVSSHAGERLAMVSCFASFFHCAYGPYSTEPHFTPSVVWGTEEHVWLCVCVLALHEAMGFGSSGNGGEKEPGCRLVITFALL